MLLSLVYFVKVNHQREVSENFAESMQCMHGSRRFCQRGSRFFLVDEGIEDPNTTMNGP